LILLITDANAFSVIISVRYIAPVGTRSNAGGKATHISKAVAAISHMRRNLGKFIMHIVKLFLMVPFTELENLATSGYRNGMVNTSGRTGINDITVYHSGSLIPLNPNNEK
jgi:hypothetical protein